MRNVKSYPVTLILAAALLVPGPAARAQTRVVASVASGSLFDGVGFGFGAGSLGPGSAFFGLSLGASWAHTHGYYSPYGIYSDTYDGWGPGYRGHRGYGDGWASCGAAYWDSYWDPWDGDCMAFAPIWSPMWWTYPAYRPWGFGFGFGFGFSTWYGPSMSVYIADPFATPWGPYWSYDPWAGYWNAWGRGLGWGRHYGYGYGGARVVYAGGRRGWGVYRPSPLVHRGPTYVEDPTTGRNTGRTAHRRGTDASATAAPRPNSRGPVAQGNPLGVPGWGDPGTVRRSARPRDGTGSAGTPGRTATRPRPGVSGAQPPGRSAQPRGSGRSPTATVPGRNARPGGSTRRPSAPARARTGGSRGSAPAPVVIRGSAAGERVPSSSARPSGRATEARTGGRTPVVRSTEPLRRPTDRLRRSELAGRPPLRADPRWGSSGRAPATRTRGGSVTPSSRFFTGPSRVASPRVRPGVGSAPRSVPSAGRPTGWSGGRSVTPRGAPNAPRRVAPSRVAPSRVRSARPSPTRSSGVGRAVPHTRTAAPRSHGGVSRAAPRSRRGGGGRG